MVGNQVKEKSIREVPRKRRTTGQNGEQNGMRMPPAK